jgi:hypothetical protein
MTRGAAELLIVSDEGLGAQQRERLVQAIGRPLDLLEKTLKRAAPPPMPTPR